MDKIRSEWILALLFCLCVLSALAQTDQTPGEPQPPSSPSPSPTPSPSPSPTPITGLHQWGAVTLFHGLPSDRVRAIAQTSDGAMWFGTEAGLAKFDGRRTQTINDPALPSGRILALQTDQDGALWVGTDAGAARFQGGAFMKVKATAALAVSAIATPQKDLAVMTTEQGRVLEIRVKQVTSTENEETVTRTVLEARDLLNQPLESKDRDRPGPLPITSLNWSNDQLLIGTQSRGLMEIKNGDARSVQMRPMVYFFNALERGQNGQLWLGAKARKEEPGALTGETPAAARRTETPTGPVLSLKSIGDEMWIGTDGRGVFRVSNTKTQRFTFDGTAGGLRSDHVYAIFPDREGVIWFGTDRGVCRFDPQAPRVESVGDGGESNFVRSLFQSVNGRVMAGTNRGLFIYDSQTSSWTNMPGMGANIIYDIAEDQTPRLLVASVSGFYIAPRQQVKFEEQAFTRVDSGSGTPDGVGSVRAIAEFHGATYYAVFGRGVERFDGGRTSLTWPNGFAREPISLLADQDRLLIGTAKDGVLVSDGKTVHEEPLFAALKGHVVRSMTRMTTGVLWFGTSDGVFACAPQQACNVAVPNVDARAVFPAVDDKVSEIWCGTRGNGLLRIRLDPVFGPVVNQLDSEQGLPSQNVFAVLPIRTPDSNNQALLIATNRGVARYVPGNVAPTLSVTRILSKRVHAPSELQAGLDLEYPQNSLLLDVTAISSRTFPEQFQYAFALDDDSGKQIRQKLSRESQFTMEGLKPGKYTVTAMAFTKDLAASEPLKFSLTVASAPFPWTSTALAILLALSLLALLWAGFERRRIVATSAALVAANRELADARLNLANEAERERRRIARDLHDQTLADLRHLALLTDQIKPNGDSPIRQTSTLRGEIESISQEVRRICEDLSPSVLQNVGFAAALEFALSHAVQDAPVEKRFEYEFHCDEAIEEHSQLPASVQMQIYRIVQEAVNNIWRHADATEVKMFVETSPAGDFALRIEDNGRPFDTKNNNAEGRGLPNMKARAGLIDARISWEPRDDGGTVFTLLRHADQTHLRSKA
jgi:signal transduction histidine kinase/ligand-binding sensor domain-containing protein